MKSALFSLLATIAIPVATYFLAEMLPPSGPSMQQRYTCHLIDGLNRALDAYESEQGHPFPAESGLDALAPWYLKKVPTDPWRNAFIIQPGSDPARVMSFGSDGIAGGSGSAEDIDGAGFLSRHPDSPSLLPWLGLFAWFALAGIAGAGFFGRRHWADGNGILAGTVAAWGLFPLAMLADAQPALSVAAARVLGVASVFIATGVMIHRRIAYADLGGFVLVLSSLVLLALFVSSVKV